MIDNWVKKGLVFAVILLFIGFSYQPIIAEKTVSVEKESDFSNVDFEQEKDYLFQTIIDIANNPDVKELFGQLKQNQKIFTSDYDYQDVFLQLLFKKPRLLKPMLFTRPEITYEYLETSYNRGLELVDIIGEEKSLEIVKSIRISDPDVLNELNSVVINNKELTKRISKLEIMNKEYPIICNLIEKIFSPIGILDYLIGKFYDNPILRFVFINLFWPLYVLFMILETLFDCREWPY